MSIVKFSVPTVSGAISKPEADPGREISIARGQTAKVTMTGYIGAPREKGDDGKYHPTSFGRLPVDVAAATKDNKNRYVLAIAGGLRGVLFPVNRDGGENSPDYAGQIDLPDNQEMPLFGRKISTDNGQFISLSSKPAQAKQSNGGQSQAEAPPTDSGGWASDDDIPF